MDFPWRRATGAVGLSIEGDTVKYAELLPVAGGRYRVGIWGTRRFDGAPEPLPEDTAPPVTYETIWLPVHMVLGKVFLGLVVVAVGLCLVVLVRRVMGWRLRHAPGCAEAEALAHRVMLVAVVFQTLMLVAGAAWARDAWGRYWAWDALETSSFLNWLLLGAALHARVSYKVPLRAGAVLILVIFIFAFFTYFGAPFYSEAAHKGVI